MSNPDDVDDEMTDYDKQELLENGLDENDLYNADNQSIIVEPPQSDAVMTHAPSTIVDEMEYLDDSDYQVDDTKPVNITLQESTAEEPEVTTIHTPPAESSIQLHPHFSPAPRMLVSQRPQTPLITTLTATTVDDPVDDEWPICLETPTGQEYILFRSDGDTEALFEDSWLKSQSLETFFSSLRQTLSDELASLTSSFAMEEIVLAIPDLEVSIAEDNCYTKEISLQDLVNLINSLHVKSGAERPETCRLLLSLQPRFIARFNQLVSLSSQSWDSTVTKPDVEADGHPEDQQNPDDDTNPGDEQNPDNDGNPGEDPTLDEAEQVIIEGAGEPRGEDVEEEIVEYEEYEGDENAEELQGGENVEEVPEYEEDDSAGSHVVDPDDHADVPEEDVDAVELEQNENDFTAAEEDELYEENDESYDPNLTEDVTGEDDQDNQDEDQGEEEHQDEDQQAEHHEPEQQEVQLTADIPEDPPVARPDSNSEDDNDNDDLISYEEAVDQTEDGQDYRQQSIDEQTQEYNGETNSDNDNDDSEIPEDIVPYETQSGDAPSQPSDVDEQDAGTPPSKRSLDEVIDLSVEDVAPPSKRAKS